MGLVLFCEITLQREQVYLTQSLLHFFFGGGGSWVFLDLVFFPRQGFSV